MKRVVVAIVLVLVVAIGFGTWWYLIRDDAPPAASLVDRDAPTSTGGGATTTSADGTWTVTEVEDTFAGFRIIENFTGGIENTAVVRSPAVSGSVVVEGSSVSEVTVEVDLTALESQDSVPPGIPGIANRVDQMRSDGLEIDSHPAATFTLTEPIELAGVPGIDAEIDADATGELTIHGVTQTVTIPIQARWSGDVVDIAGSLPITLADYGMEAPERPFVSVEDVGTMEFQLVLRRSA